MGWTKPYPVLYRIFDCTVGLVFMEGTGRANSFSLLPGKVKHYLMATIPCEF